ncbi:MAG: metallophosphoesterase family protein [Anaerolineae bacterium]|nr:metallophosphoesterase family protein [Anaerolineae bacterium]
MSSLFSTPFLLRILYAALYAAAGLGLFLIFLNRLLIQMKDGSVKALATLVTFVIIPAGAAVAGFVIGPSGWTLIPILIIAGLLLGEMRRLVIRKKFQGSQPNLTKTAPQSLGRIRTTTDLVIAHYTIEVNSWPGDHLRIAHLSDFHMGYNLPAGYYDLVVESANDAEPDLVFLTGDFVAARKHTSMLPGPLGRLRSRHGIYAVLGNHDYWAGADDIASAISGSGITLLRDAYQRMQIKGPANVLIGGCEIPWSDPLWQSPPIQPGELALALSHTPDNIYRLNNEGWHVVFAGHYHGGQVRIPYLGPLVVPSIYGRRFDRGHFIVRGTHLLVSAGVGTASTARIYCPPDIFIVDIIGRGSKQTDL